MSEKKGSEKYKRVDCLFLLCVMVKSFEKQVEQQCSIAGFCFTFVPRYLLDSFFVYFYSHNTVSTQQFHLDSSYRVMSDFKRQQNNRKILSCWQPVSRRINSSPASRCGKLRHRTYNALVRQDVNQYHPCFFPCFFILKGQSAHVCHHLRG